MSTHVVMRAVDAIVPLQLLQQIQEQPLTPKAQESLEKLMATTAGCVVKLIQGAIRSLNQHKIKELDANPGDGGCQLRAMILRILTIDPEIGQELERLQPLLKNILAGLRLRHQNKGFLGPMTVVFEKEVSAPLQLSRKLLYLVDCRLLTLTKVKDHVEPNGVIVTRTCISRLSQLHSGMDSIDKELREQFIAGAATRVSKESLQFLQEMSAGLSLSSLTCKMIQQVRLSKPYKNLPPKSFGCLFYEMQVILRHLKQHKAPIAIKTIVLEGKPSYFFLQSLAEGEEFTVVEQSLPLEARIVVFEGVVSPTCDKETFIRKVQEIGFSKMILVCSAQEAPFEPGSTLENIDDLDARAEIEVFRKEAQTIGCDKKSDPLFLLDHIFCNSIKEEKP